MPDSRKSIALLIIAQEEQRYSLDKPLRRAGFTIRDATNGEEGLLLAMELPDLILLDLDLPDMSGVEVCARLKAQPATASIPVLHLSAVPFASGKLTEQLARGDEAYLTYPVEEVELLSFVNTLIRGRQAQRQFRSFLEAAPDAVVISDQAGIIAQVNEQTERMFGYGREELIGQAVEILLPERLRERHKQLRAQYAKDPSTRPMGVGLNLSGLRKDGSEFSVEISLSSMPDRQGISIACILRDVTERKLVEERIRRSEHLQKYMLDSMPQKIGTAKANGDVDYFNRQWTEFTGLTFEQLRTWGWKRVIHPDDLPGHISAWRHAIETGERFDYESRFRRADGVYRWHVSRATPMSDETGQIVMWVGSNTDIHDIKHAESALQVSEVRYRRLFETAKDGILILDANTGLITDSNPYMSELLGYSHEHFLGKELWEIGLFSDKSANEAAVRELQKNGYIRYEHLPLETSAGKRAEVEIVANSYHEGGHNVIQCNIRDITERSHLECQLREQAVALEDLHRRKDEFLAMLSHELRNPLSPITSALYLLGLQKNEDPLQYKARTIIERQVGQLTRLIDDLLEVSRITTGRIHLKQERIGLSGIVENAVETVRPLIVRHKHALTISLSSQPIWLFADAARLEQVVVNLLTNAAKFTLDDGQIWITSQLEGEECVLRVRDNGIGIAPEMLPHVFDLFTQAERSLDRAQGGLGIGLALVQRIVEMHKGRVKASSVLGQGAEFAVYLPVIPPPSDHTPGANKNTVLKNQNALRVLIVDDNEDAAELLGMLLLNSGYEILIVHDGPSALLAAQDYRPHVILLDIGLPGMNGFEVAKNLREQGIFKNVILVAMTGYGQHSDHQRSKGAGFDHHLVKPPDFNKLQQILAVAVESAVQ